MNILQSVFGESQEDAKSVEDREENQTESLAESFNQEEDEKLDPVPLPVES